MAEQLRHAHVIENGASDFAVDIEVSGHTLQGDEPVSSGGKDVGPAPYDLLVAALGECSAMTVRWYAKQQNWPLDKVEVKLTHCKQPAADMVEATKKTGRVDVFEKQVILYGDALTADQRTTLIEVAAKCPVQRTLQSEVIIRTC